MQMDLMSLIILALLVLAALIAAWCSGAWWAKRKVGLEQPDSNTQSYFRGINFLLNEEPDESVDVFINSLEVNAQTLDTHLAFGNLMRRRGEVDRAIRIHQNLLSRPSLSKEQVHQAQLELARDFMVAGLLDRAERLMLDLVEMSERFRQPALKYLIEIYREEHEWEKAIRAAGQLAPRRLLFGGSKLCPEQAHFCCELAEQALSKGEYLEVRRQLKAALKYDKNSVRASLLWGRLEVRQGNYKEALKHFDKIVAQDPDYLPEAVDHICTCYRKLGKGDELTNYLTTLIEKYPTSSLLVALADQISITQNPEQASEFLTRQLKKSPSIKALMKLLKWQSPQNESSQQQNRLLMQSLERLQLLRPTHRCSQCGFSGRQLHWLCPACKSWGSVKPIKGIEGE